MLAVLAVAALSVLPVLACAAGESSYQTIPGPPLRFAADTFGFANQTVYIYPNGYAEKRHLKPGEKAPAFTLHCFAMCRSVEQFRKFARFDPSLPPPNDAKLDVLLRRVNRHAVWRAALPPEQRVVIPGYADLRALSEARPLSVQKHVGGGIWTYLRPGNWRMFSYWWNGPSEQARERRILDDLLDHNDVFIAYLTAYPSLSINHAVVLYGRRSRTADDVARGQTHYLVYDPNHPESPRDMIYDARKDTFSYQKDWDFVGGRVIVLRTYGFWLQ